MRESVKKVHSHSHLVNRVCRKIIGRPEAEWKLLRTDAELSSSIPEVQLNQHKS